MIYCSTQLTFDFYTKSKSIVDFQGGDLPSDTGLWLVRQADERLGLTEGFASCMEDSRNPFFTVQSLTDQVRQQVYQICGGYEDDDDSDDVWKDPVFDPVYEHLPTEDVDLASQPTMSRLENRVTREDLSRLRRFFLEKFIDSYSSPPAELILNVDGWDYPAHGYQQLMFWHGHFGPQMYYPVQFSEADTGRPIVFHLCPGKSHDGKGIERLLAWLFWRLREAWPSARITLRGDCGFILSELLKVCERFQMEYVLGISTNDVLKRKAADLKERARLEWYRTGRKVRLFDDVYYAAKTWTEPRRVIIKAEHLTKVPNLRFVVANRFDDPRELYDQVYVQRGEDCENRIKELKCGLKADRLSYHDFLANQFRLHLFQAACWLMLRVRDAAVGTQGQQLF